MKRMSMLVNLSPVAAELGKNIDVYKEESEKVRLPPPQCTSTQLLPYATEVNR